MATPQSVIKSFMNFLDGTSFQSADALDAAVKSVSNFSSWSELQETMVEDCAAYSGNYIKFLSEECDINLYNDDTGAITGSDAKGGSTKTASSVVPESGSWSYPTSTSFTKQGLTVNLPEENTLTDSQHWIVGALYSWWIDSALTLANQSFGLNFNESGTTVKEITVRFVDASNGQLAAVYYNDEKTSHELYLEINMHYYDGISQTDPDGVSNSSVAVSLDRTIAHEMVHAVMAANINYFYNLPLSFKEGVAELVHGIDDKRLGDIITLASSSSKLSSAFSGSGTSAYAAGYMLLRYLAKQAAAGRKPSDKREVVSEPVETPTATETTSTTTTTPTTTKPSTTTTTTTPTEKVEKEVKPAATFTSNKKTLNVQGTYTKDIWLGENVLSGAASSFTNSDTVTIDASKMTSKKILAGNENNNVIKAGQYGSTLWGGASGNDTLTGGGGRDMFWYGEGDGSDVITDFKSGTEASSDVLNLYSGAPVSITRASGKVFLGMSDESSLSIAVGTYIDKAIQLFGNDLTKIKIGNTSGTSNFTYESEVNSYLGSSKVDTLSVDSSSGKVEIWLSDEKYSSLEVINAKNSSGANILVGNESNNSIIGGSGSSSLWGGSSSSNDTLIGGNGSEIFWYGLGEGDDVIKGVTEADTINLYNVTTEDIFSAEVFANHNMLISMKVGGSLTVNGNTLPTINLADGSAWKYDTKDKNWKLAN